MYLVGHVSVRDAMRELTEAGYVVETDNHHVYARAVQKLINKKGK